MTLRIDHVVFCVTDLEQAGDHFEERYGVVSHIGGRHPGHGTRNRIVPLGDAYLELVAIVDRTEAADSSFGSWVERKATHPPTPHALCLRTDDIEEVCERLDLEPISMTRENPDGVTLRWRLAGLEQALTETLPFFVEWEVPDGLLPGRASPGNEAGVDGVILSGDTDRLRRWIDGARGVTIQSDIRPIQVVLNLGDKGLALIPG